MITSRSRPRRAGAHVGATSRPVRRPRRSALRVDVGDRLDLDSGRSATAASAEAPKLPQPTSPSPSGCGAVMWIVVRRDPRQAGDADRAIGHAVVDVERRRVAVLGGLDGGREDDVADRARHFLRQLGLQERLVDRGDDARHIIRVEDQRPRAVANLGCTSKSRPGVPVTPWWRTQPTLLDPDRRRPSTDLERSPRAARAVRQVGAARTASAP